MSVVEPVVPVAAEDDATGVRALRKASVRLIPLIALGYGTAYMDRVNISFASLQMNRDLHFSATVYGFGAGLFFLSYAACEIPSNLLLYRFGARRWLARIMLTWGLLAMGMMLVRTPIQFYAMRFLLGVAEAGFFPGVIYYLMQWFPAEMRARSVGRFYISLPLSSVVMGVIAGGLLNLQGRLGLAGWQWLFLVEGLPALVLSVVFLKVLPDGPRDAKWLTEPERAWILGRLESDARSEGNHDDLRGALKNPRVWMISLLFMGMLACNYAFTFSAPAIIQEVTRFGTTKVGFVVALINLLGAPAMLLNAWHSDRMQERHWHVAIPFLAMALGYGVSGVATRPVLVVPALALGALGFFSMQGALWAYPASFIKGKSAAAGVAIMNMIGMLGGFIGPYWMGRAKDWTGNYQRGLLALVIPSLMGAALMLAMKQMGKRTSPSRAETVQ